MKLIGTPTRLRSPLPALAGHSAFKLSLLALAIGSPFSVQAQEPASRAQLEEILVTATRRETSLQSIPISISAVSGTELESRGITDFKQLGEAVSGLSLVQPEGFVSSALYIRGVGTAGNSSGEKSVGVLVDGVYQLKQGAVFSEMLDVERVEVMRGPQGTLFGKNTTAGVIAIKTRDPDTEELSGRLQGVVGNLSSRELRGVLNIPLVEGKLAARVSGFTAERDGYTKNTYINRDTRNVDREGFRGKLLWNVTDDLNVLFSGERIRQNSRMDQSLMQYPEGLQEANPQLPAISLGKSAQQPSEVRDDFQRYVLTVNWDLPYHTLTSISSFEDNKGSILSDQDYTILEPEGRLTMVANTAHSKAKTQEIQLSSNWDGPINYILGGFWQNEKLNSSTSLFMGSNGVAIPRPPSTRDIDSKAVFGNVSWQISESWDVSLGARYTEDEKVGQNAVFSGIKKFDKTTYSFKLRHQSDAGNLYYFAYDTGFKSGGINREFNACGAGGACLDPGYALWKPETTKNYEIGVKSDWLDNTLRLNAALFYQIYDDYQVNQEVPGEATVFLANAAKVVSKGVEADFSWLASNHLTLGGTVSLIETKYDKYRNAPCATLTVPGCVDGAQDLTGKRLDQAPRIGYTLTADYRDDIDHFNGVEWFVGVEWAYKSKHNVDLLLSPETQQSAYHLINTRIGFEQPDQWRVTGWVRNLSDKTYVVSGLYSPSGLRLTRAMPRTYGVTLDWFF